MFKKSLFFTLFLTLAPLSLFAAQSMENPKKADIYVVKKGDCLWNISKKVWGHPKKWPLLFATNETKIRNPNLIYPGQKLTIPTSITTEELEKAVQMAQSRAESIPVLSKQPEGKALHQRQLTVASSKTSPSSSTSELAPSNPPQGVNEKPANAENPSIGAPQSQEAPAATSSAGHSSKIILLIITLLVLVAGLYLWKRRGGSSSLQQPKPLSSFPAAGGESPLNRPSPSPAPAGPAAPRPDQFRNIPSQPTVTQPNAPRINQPSSTGQASINPPGNKPEGTATITNASVSPSQAPLPLKVEPPAQPAPSPTVQPATPPPSQASGENQPTVTPSKPPSNNP